MLLSCIWATAQSQDAEVIQISGEHLGFGNSFVCFAANVKFNAASLSLAGVV